ncbi:TrkA family potassium uptake protein [Coriobacteriia bacterium Es71-Z0120]|uniref:potassium channel family protein n=1 Tax=Parvivirga hydrogeniphila TaxID=2939460 RepID=UPI00226095E0|nr:TrkA family potassium uptake protein [Parvivirga hydrogeniphila]MCL4078151.1 TrkA family potassium uptake protein [Parvivirga hydrogeniphila]
MNIIVVGCGRVGSQLATMLSVEGHNVTVIDRDEAAFKRLGTTFNGISIRGLGFDEEVLEEAGIHEADVFAAVTNLDNTNLMAAEVARKLFGVRHVVARLYNPVRERTYQQLGLDYVCGTTLVAESLVEKIKAGHGHHLNAVGDIELVEFKASAEVDGKRVRDVEVARGFRVAAILRGANSIVPDEDTQLKAGDILVGAVHTDQYQRIQPYMED